MNIVMDEATEVYVKDAKPRRELGTLFVFLYWLFYISLQVAFSLKAIISHSSNKWHDISVNSLHKYYCILLSCQW